MRELEFRGQSINGKWYYGLLSESHGNSSQPKKGFYISNSVGMPWAYQVRPETVGQFTGLQDKNVKDIYEGDIVKCFVNEKEVGAVDVIEFQIGCFWLRHRYSTLRHFLIEIDEVDGDFEIIGNIHESPELLK